MTIAISSLVICGLRRCTLAGELRQRHLAVAGAHAQGDHRNSGGHALDALLLGGEQLLHARGRALADEDDAGATEGAVDHGGRVDVTRTGDVRGDGLTVGVPPAADRGQRGASGAGLALDLAVGGALGAAAQ